MELISSYQSALTSSLSKYLDQHTGSWNGRLLITTLSSVCFILYKDMMWEKCIANKSYRVKKEKDFFFSIAGGGDGDWGHNVSNTASCNFSLPSGFKFPDQGQQLPEFFQAHSCSASSIKLYLAIFTLIHFSFFKLSY